MIFIDVPWSTVQLKETLVEFHDHANIESFKRIVRCRWSEINAYDQVPRFLMISAGTLASQEL